MAAADNGAGASRHRVEVTIADHVAEVRLDRPEVHNALDFAMFGAIGAAIDELAADASVRAVVLHGAGPSFCPASTSRASPRAAPRSRRCSPAATARTRTSPSASPTAGRLLPAPVICAVHGNCLGGGAQIALGADIRIIAPDATLSIREVHWGLIPDMGITRSLPRLVRSDVAKELVLTARMLDGAEAARLGLATRVGDDPLAAARGLAAEIAARSPDATRRAKALIERAWTMAPADSLALEEELQRELLGTASQMKAVEAGMGGDPGEFDDPA
ncbi:MAG: crotonase/enoyl-CoA hydratase family protein [Solirubrobacterales bacterium]